MLLIPLLLPFLTYLFTPAASQAICLDSDFTYVISCQAGSCRQLFSVNGGHCSGYKQIIEGTQPPEQFLGFIISQSHGANPTGIYHITTNDEYSVYCNTQGLKDPAATLQRLAELWAEARCDAVYKTEVVSPDASPASICQVTKYWQDIESASRRQAERSSLHVYLILAAMELLLILSPLLLIGLIKLLTKKFAPWSILLAIPFQRMASYIFRALFDISVNSVFPNPASKLVGYFINLLIFVVIAYLLYLLVRRIAKRPTA